MKVLTTKLIFKVIQFKYFVKLYQLIWLNVVRAQWLKYQFCELQITNLIFENFFFIQNCIFFHLFDLYIYFS